MTGSVAARRFDAVLFDFTGVVTSSPWDDIGGVGSAAGHDPAEVLEVMVGPYHEDTDHPMHRLERGEIAAADYAVEVMELAEEAGLDIDLRSLLGLLGRLEVHDEVVARIVELRTEGYRTALVTNNVREASGEWRTRVALADLFDVVVDSSEVGMRKPDPRIYRHTLDALGGVAPERAVFLDDAPGNVEGARRAGLAAIQVTTPDQALRELDQLLGRA